MATNLTAAPKPRRPPLKDSIKHGTDRNKVKTKKNLKQCMTMIVTGFAC